MNSMKKKKRCGVLIAANHRIDHLHVVFPSIFQSKTVQNGVASNKTSEKIISEPTELERRTVKHATQPI